jgi:hypothetical protein
VRESVLARHCFPRADSVVWYLRAHEEEPEDDRHLTKMKRCHGSPDRAELIGEKEEDGTRHDVGESRNHQHDPDHFGEEPEFDDKGTIRFAMTTAAMATRTKMAIMRASFRSTSRNRCEVSELG